MPQKRIHTEKIPTYLQMEKAIKYRILLDDLASLFEASNLPVVSKCLSNACKEIDGAWQKLYMDQR